MNGHPKIDVAEVKTTAVRSLLNRFGKDLEAVVLIGSYARGEATEQSDLDFFVAVRGLPKQPVKRRYVVYDALTPILREFKHEVSVIEADAEEIGKQITPLLINIAHDGIILYDREGRMENLLRRVRNAVKKAGLVRYKTRDRKYGWKPRRKLRPGEVFTIQLEDET